MAAATGGWIGYGEAAVTEFESRPLADAERIILGDVALAIIGAQAIRLTAAQPGLDLTGHPVQRSARPGAPVEGDDVASARDARPMDRRSALPLWAQLQEDLTRRLAVGAFRSGFPGELELVETYRVSRHTVREALRRLRESGVLESGRGRATRVRREIEQPLGGLYSLFREVEARGMVQTSQVLDLSLVSDQAAADALGLEADAPLVHLERLRLADHEPLAHDRVWLPAELAMPLLQADFSHGALYDQLATRCGVRLSAGQERITAVIPPPALRSLLRLPRGQGCLRVERAGRVGARVIEHRITTVRGDRYAVLTQWSAQGYSLRADAAGPTDVTAAGSSRSRTAGTGPQRVAAGAPTTRRARSTGGPPGR